MGTLSSPRVAIVAARRTPQGKFLGGLAKHSATELAVIAGNAALNDLKEPKDAITFIDEVIVGNVLSAGLGMNIARQVALGLNLPISSQAFTINMMCASGLKAIMLGCDAVKMGRARMVLCGGTESMSQAPYLLPRVRSGLKLGDSVCVDSILKDGLVDAFDHQHMGLTAERLASQFSISRCEQDAFSLDSQHRYHIANERGVFLRELTPVGSMTSDEHPRADTTLASLEKLKPAFDKMGTVTAGNASGLNDGAAMVLVCDEILALKQGWDILAIIEDYTAVGCEPAQMGLGPVYASALLLSRLSADLDDYDSVEINEAFAAQTLACLRSMPLNPEKLNRCGGAIAMGHPIGASGARLVVHLANRIADKQTHRGLASLCVGGGMGVAMSLTSPR